jgi:glycosyltransferase involved in cell wall biosynthesis
MHEKNICVLLNCNIKNDGRVKKMLRTYARFVNVDLFYIHGEVSDKDLFPGNVNLVSIELNQPQNFFQKLKRALFFWREYDSFVHQVLSEGKQYSAIVANDLPTLKPAAELKKKFQKCILIYDSHEIYIETVNQFYPKSSGTIRNIINSFLIFVTKQLGTFAERKYLKSVDYFITVNDSLAKYFSEKYLFPKVHVMKNCPESSVPEQHVVSEIRNGLNLKENETAFLYQGVINKGRALELFIKALKDTPQHIRFYLIGYGSYETELKQLAENLNISHRVTFLGKVAHEQLKNYTPAFDFGVNMGGGNLSKDMGLSNKLFEYFHAGIPVICTDNAENRTIYNKYQFGLLTNNSHEDIVKKIIELAEKNNYNFYKKNCLRASQEYNWESESLVINNILNESILK